MTAIVPPAGNQFLPVDVFCGKHVPDPKSIQTVIDFTTTTNQPSWSLDLTNTINQAKMEQVQSVFIDNSKNAAAVTIQSVATGQSITLAANSQGYLPFLQPNPPQITISSTPAAGLFVPIYWLNFPVNAAVWKTQ